MICCGVSPVKSDGRTEIMTPLMSTEAGLINIREVSEGSCAKLYGLCALRGITTACNDIPVSRIRMLSFGSPVDSSAGSKAKMEHTLRSISSELAACMRNIAGHISYTSMLGAVCTGQVVSIVSQIGKYWVGAA